MILLPTSHNGKKITLWIFKDLMPGLIRRVFFAHTGYRVAVLNEKWREERRN